MIRVLGHFASAGWQLWKACAAAEESSQRKDEFLAMLGHELRNPLAAIRSATRILDKLVATEGDVRRAVEIVARQAGHLSRMVADLADLARISRGKLQLEVKPIELQAVVADAVETTRPEIERRRHRLSVELPTAPIRLDADPIRLAQLLSNLLDNAAKYTPEEGQVWLTVEATAGQVHITVRDTGVGIPEAQLRGIFDRFTQREASRERSAGLGLGLTLVRTLAEMHGGSAEAASDGPGQGSRFTVRLPIVSMARGTVPPNQAPRHAEAPTPRRILLVEDNQDVGETLALALALDGHTVRIVRDGPAALEVVPAFDPEVVLLDVGLPGMTGYDVARRLRQDPERAGLLIIAVSGYGNEEHRRLSEQAGCDAHLLKPVDPDAFRPALDRAAPRRP
jgi:two-component system CheB/CheR fusion protein